eukprot:COSAG05_NODE_1322_length_5190_cov_6.444507_1_plen_201_part_00
MVGDLLCRLHLFGVSQAEPTVDFPQRLEAALGHTGQLRDDAAELDEVFDLHHHTVLDQRKLRKVALQVGDAAAVPAVERPDRHQLRVPVKRRLELLHLLGQGLHTGLHALRARASSVCRGRQQHRRRQPDRPSGGGPHRDAATSPAHPRRGGRRGPEGAQHPSESLHLLLGFGLAGRRTRVRRGKHSHRIQTVENHTKYY